MRPLLEALQAYRSPRGIETELFEPLAIIGVDAHVGMKGKAVLSRAARRFRGGAQLALRCGRGRRACTEAPLSTSSASVGAACCSKRPRRSSKRVTRRAT